MGDIGKVPVAVAVRVISEILMTVPPGPAAVCVPEVGSLDNASEAIPFVTVPDGAVTVVE